MPIRTIIGSRSSRNAAASYAAFASTFLWGFACIPVAVKHLSTEEIGLWAVVQTLLGYLVWVDLGVGPATGRLLADPVVKRDQAELNRWWSVMTSTLWVQGIVVALLGAAAAPLLPGLLRIPTGLHDQARFLILSGALITGAAFPMRGAAGLLTAQNRFYWCPMIQAVSPWIHFVVFLALLKSGFGLRAYIGALAVSQVATWWFYRVLIRRGPDRPRWDASGVTSERVRRLFAFSGNIAVSGIVESLLQTLPQMVIARMSGVAAVPMYNFSSKGPLLGGQLVVRCLQSFYPGLQHLYVAGESEAFKARHRHAGMLTVAVSLLAAAGVIALNPVIVGLLAGNRFYAGPAANLWFAAAAVSLPLASVFQLLLPISGSMGRSAVVSVAKLLLGGAAAIFALRHHGLPGIAAVFAMLPWIDCAYAYLRGARNCGFTPRSLSPQVLLLGTAAFAATCLAGYLAIQPGMPPPAPTDPAGLLTLLSSPGMIAASPLLLTGMVLLALSLRAMLARIRPAAPAA